MTPPTDPMLTPLGTALDEPEANGRSVVKQILTQHGPIALIALFLIWWTTQTLAPAIREQRDELKSELTGMRQTLGQHVVDMQIQRYYLRQICLNSAKDQTQRDGCLGVDR